MISKTGLKRLKRGLKHIFVALHTLLILGILLASALFYIAFRPDGLQLVNTFILTPLGIEYKSAEGSLKDGLSLHNIHTETIDIKTLKLDYNLTKILYGKHTIDSIHIDGLRVHLDDFISEGESSSLPLPTFALKEVNLTNLQLISVYPIELDIHAKNGSFDGKNLNFQSLTASVRTQYASGALQGVLKNNAIQGEGVVYPNAKELDPYVADFTTLPTAQRVEILELSDSKVRLATQLSSLNAAFDEKMTLNTISIGMNYHYSDHYLDFNAHYLLKRDDNQMLTTQTLRYNLNGTTTTTFNGILTTPQIPLPTNIVTGNFRDDRAGLAGNISLANSTLLLQSSDYQHYKFHTEIFQRSLDFLHFLPKTLQDSPLSGKCDGIYSLHDKQADGNFTIDHNHAKLSGKFLFQNSTLKLNADTILPSDAPTWNNWSIKPPSQLELSLTYSVLKSHLSLNGKDLALSLERYNERVEGSGNYLGTFFDITGSHNNEQTDVTITSITPSLSKTLNSLPNFTPPNLRYYDAEVRTSTHITYDTTLHIATDISLPWYAIIMDSARQYSGVNSHANLRYDENNITLINYTVDIANHQITSNKPSSLHIDQGHLFIDEAWIFDALRLNGDINLDTLAITLHLKSDRFSYNGPEGNAHIALDLQYIRDENLTQKLAGQITLLDGEITYLPLQQFKVMDDDVIIVQDVAAPNNGSLAMDVKIIADQPLHYLTKELDLYITPNITLWKDPLDAMELLGMITIPKGKMTTTGKTFTLRPSYIYFGGSVPINPYLDITADYEVDYKKIEIYVTHRLDSPMFLFNSDPFMNQNDIMSYIIFGAPASTALSSNSGSDVSARADATNFMLGAGLKGLIGGATKIQIDTMNILTTKEGGMGFEVGARLNKDLRVVYKNDTVSSVLVQYTVNRWLRLDADIHALGQGINAIYIKDFRDFLPHNEATHKVRDR
ncbi:MAG: translocation/assembly module TamB domain-containing protein [Sulfuricurvum sp.]|uniref:translocation/assembly module TamB domain-containing protein n=1 Tax=Sulfuricurvum sp. TaxID=2025608 RepID=UPI002620B4AC|nr:translocation/assembly module TamB domain-containing protein [Sulfuricurvum sp.]MDD2828339.1 translocation/assembly module TamB domain-containing protein [Sulfuricurvum sp.]MDD4949344.1 translocation/assembly module TamB domain-containing protein [Sulfuricurvum sp.]